METKTPVTVHTNEKEISVTHINKKVLDELADNPIKISGVLGAPHQFLIGKKFDTDKTHLRVYLDKGKIELFINDTDPRTMHSVTGELTPDKYLEEWCINSDTETWSSREFLLFIRTKKFFFFTPEEQKDLIEQLQKFESRIERIFTDHNDNSGNSKVALETKVNEIQLRRKFTLAIPLFQGYPKRVFDVEIGIKPTATTVELFLFSEQLFTMILEEREKLINEEVAKFDEYKFSKIVVS